MTATVPQDLDPAGAAHIRRLGARLVRPDEAPLPWRIRQIARRAATAAGVSHEVALQLVCEGVADGPPS